MRYGDTQYLHVNLKGEIKMDKQSYTIQEVIELTINNLAEISVPVSLSEGIAIPIMGAISNLQLVLKAMNDENTKKEEPIDGRETDA
jgi:hypothetical protein